jgi:hypothetical protein
MFTAIAPCAAGCEPINVYPDAGRVLLAYNTPALAALSTIFIQIAVYRVT